MAVNLRLAKTEQSATLHRGSTSHARYSTICVTPLCSEWRLAAFVTGQANCLPRLCPPRSLSLDRLEAARCKSARFLAWFTTRKGLALDGTMISAASPRCRFPPAGPHSRLAGPLARILAAGLPAPCWRDLAGSFGLPPGIFGHALPPVALSPALLAARRACWRTALALADIARPRLSIHTGRIIVLEENDALVQPSGKGPPANSAALMAASSPLLRPFAHCLLRPKADEVAQWPVPCLAGPAGKLVRLIEETKRAALADSVHKVWPGLGLVLASVQPEDPELRRLRAELGNDAVVLEMHLRPEGPVAIKIPEAACSACWPTTASSMSSCRRRRSIGPRPVGSASTTCRWAFPVTWYRPLPAACGRAVSA